VSEINYVLFCSVNKSVVYYCSVLLSYQGHRGTITDSLHSSI